MTPEISSIALVVGLFLLGVGSPGPNFLVVAERAMASGFRDGILTGLVLVFSREFMRDAYRRFRRALEMLFGGALVLFGIRLALAGRPR